MIPFGGGGELQHCYCQKLLIVACTCKDVMQSKYINKTKPNRNRPMTGSMDHILWPVTLEKIRYYSVHRSLVIY